MMKKITLLVGVVSSYMLSAQTITLTYDGNGNRLTKQRITNVPVAVITGDSLVCEGEVAQLTATGGGTYLWWHGPAQPGVSVIADTSRMYTVVVTNGPGCKDTATKLIEVIPLVNLTAVVGDSIVNANQQVTYSVPDAANTFYDWTVSNGTILSGYGTHQITVIWDVAGTQGNVSVTAQAIGTNCQTGTQGKPIQILPVGIAAVGFQNFNLYPNPSQTDVNVNFETSDVSPVSITITNALGVQVYSAKHQGNQSYFLKFPRHVFGAAGIYTLHLKSDKASYSENITITQ